MLPGLIYDMTCDDLPGTQMASGGLSPVSLRLVVLGTTQHQQDYL